MKKKKLEIELAKTKKKLVKAKSKLDQLMSQAAAVDTDVPMVLTENTADKKPSRSRKPA